MTDDKKEGGEGPQWFLPNLVGKKVNIRLMDGRPLQNVTLCAFNPYELLVEAQRGKKMILYKHGIMTIEYDESVQQGQKQPGRR